jgi:intracellular sulfur oxidation DsrE/DsrF family protein
MSNSAPSTPRRGFVAGIAATVVTLVAGRWSPAVAEGAPFAALPIAGDEWVARITGKHRQVFDCMTANGGFGAAFSLNFIDTVKASHKVTDKDVTAVVSLRHLAVLLALDDAMWSKYKIGEMIDVKDPKTGAPATRNVFRDGSPGHPGLTYEQMMTTRGVVFTACNMALGAMSGMAAPKAGVTADQAKNEWTAHLIPGVYLAPSGVYVVNRAQEAGCTYCFGG